MNATMSVVGPRAAMILLVLACPGSGRLCAQVNNDTCDQAVLNGVFLAPGSNGPFSNGGATASGVLPSCSVNSPIPTGLPPTDVWFAFVPTTTCTLTIDPGQSALLLPLIAVYDGTGFGGPASCGTLPELACSLVSPLQVSVPAGTMILIQVAEIFPGFASTFTLQLDLVFGLAIAAPGGPGSLVLTNSCGISQAPFITAVSLNQGAFPQGWFYGVDIGIPDLVTEIGSGLPFFGTLDLGGGSSFVIPAGVPSGVTLYAVSLVLSPQTGVPLVASPPLTFTTL